MIGLKTSGCADNVLMTINAVKPFQQVLVVTLKWKKTKDEIKILK